MELGDFADCFGQTVDAGPEVGSITQDSRKADAGSLFFALSGSKADGAKFVADAVAKGAVAIVTDLKADVGTPAVPVIRVNDTRRALALTAAKFYGRQPETMVAVTGTAGKTSVAGFTRQIWAHAGRQAAFIGTTGVVAPGRNDYGSLTTPETVELHALLKELADNGVTHASMEASSHGLDQRRLDGVKLAAGAFTNLGRDHLDYHPTIEEYLKAKLRLFDTLLAKGTPSVIWADDAYSAPVIEASKSAGLKVMSVGRSGSFIALKRVEHERRRQRVEVSHGGEIFEIDLPWRVTFK